MKIIQNPAFLQAAGNANGAETYFYFKALEDNCTIIMTDSRLSGIRVSLNKKDWFYNNESSGITLNKGQKLYIGNIYNVKSATSASASPFVVTANFEVGGFLEGASTNDKYNFLFAGLTTLISAEKMTFGEGQANNSHAYLFYGCINMEYAPKQIVCRYSLYGWNNAFMDCTKLKESPIIIATAQNSEYLFRGCSALQKITCLTDEVTKTDGEGWLTGVADTGVFIKKPGVEWVAGEDGIPSGWTVQDYVA